MIPSLRPKPQARKLQILKKLRDQLCPFACPLKPDLQQIFFETDSRLPFKLQFPCSLSRGAVQPQTARDPKPGKPRNLKPEAQTLNREYESPRSPISASDGSRSGTAAKPLFWLRDLVSEVSGVRFRLVGFKERCPGQADFMWAALENLGPVASVCSTILTHHLT